jgi:hypothetical protein
VHGEIRVVIGKILESTDKDGHSLLRSDCPETLHAKRPVAVGATVGYAAAGVPQFEEQEISVARMACGTDSHLLLLPFRTSPRKIQPTPSTSSPASSRHRGGP